MSTNGQENRFVKPAFQRDVLFFEGNTLFSLMQFKVLPLDVASFTVLTGTLLTRMQNQSSLASPYDQFVFRVKLNDLQHVGESRIGKTHLYCAIYTDMICS
jgi:hypothetical protein